VVEEGMNITPCAKNLIKPQAAAMFGCLMAAIVFAADANAQAVEAIGGGDVMKLQATVEAIDMNRRTVTLTGQQGDTFTLPVSDRVKNLDMVKKGDIVSATYYDWLAIAVRKGGAGGEQPSASVVVDAASAPKGEKPAGGEIKQVKVIADVIAVDMQRPSITLKGPLGNQREIRVKDKSVLDGVQPGEQVELTYTEALAIAVEPKT
jgi:hypothetical protein